MSIPRPEFEGPVYGPIETAGVVITPEGRRIWSDNLPPTMLRKLVNRNGEPCNGVYFHCIKDRVNVHSRIEEGNVRLDVLLNNTCFHKILWKSFPNGLDGMEAIKKYSGMEMGAPTFVKIVKGLSGIMIQGCELGVEKHIKLHDSCALDEKISELAKSEICHGSRIIKTGKADQSIQGRIDGYRRLQASITKYCYGFANNVFQRLELFFIDINEFNSLGKTHLQNFTPKTPEALETDFMNTFRSVHNSLPPWEQRRRYSAVRDGIPEPSYNEILSELLDVIENPRKKEE